ncbi:branched-chain-amino-acid aminotransferase [Seminavis robusta]|uniref:Branched-chain-amino-acid aminotransferase n=1 Tax=Seminavis robusta TaxID=568900 RepID=A0A9N8DNM6_9STRA|nr:branched-chain-amino-acid aminotransferase [Seminavis robusta]|eukprot:Sro183_g079650.1 branched-chain-amino-acid aminotransferase (311) ;mRNA; r:45001-45933
MTMDQEKKITVVHCWTAPRSRSTALLYSFEARGKNCVAIDEPLKREWLISKGNQVQRPYQINMIEGVPPNDRPEEELLWKRETLSLGERIHAAAQKLMANDKANDTDNEDPPLIFIKHMSKTHFLYDFENDVHVESIPGVHFVHKHMFLIRDPVAILRSWDVLSGVHHESCSTEDVGIVPLVSIYTALRLRLGLEVPVTIMDSDKLVADPPGVLLAVCKELGVPYKPSMMTWKAGPHQCDSRHAPWWYVNALASTGWKIPDPNAPNKKETPVKPLNQKLLPALKDSFPAYEILLRCCAARGESANHSMEN